MCAGALAQVSEPAERRVNVIADAVRAIAAEGEEDTALLLVFVVDDAGDPIDEVPVSVSDHGKPIGSGKTDSRGRVLLRLAVAGPVSVRAADTGFVPAVARGVVLRRAGLTSLALPLEQAPAR